MRKLLLMLGTLGVLQGCASSTQPNADLSEDIPQGRGTYTELYCRGTMLVQSDLTTSGTVRPSYDPRVLATVETTTSGSLAQRVSVERRIRFNEERNAFWYKGSTPYKGSVSGWVPAYSVSFDDGQVHTTFKRTARSQASLEVATLGMSRLTGRDASFGWGTLNRRAGTWATADYEIPCSEVQGDAKVF